MGGRQHRQMSCAVSWAWVARSGAVGTCRNAARHRARVPSTWRMWCVMALSLGWRVAASGTIGIRCLSGATGTVGAATTTTWASSVRCSRRAHLRLRGRLLLRLRPTRSRRLHGHRLRCRPLNAMQAALSLWNSSRRLTILGDPSTVTTAATTVATFAMYIRLSRWLVTARWIRPIGTSSRARAASGCQRALLAVVVVALTGLAGYRRPIPGVVIRYPTARYASRIIHRRATGGHRCRCARARMTAARRRRIRISCLSHRAAMLHTALPVSPFP